VKRKLSFKQQHALETLPKRIDAAAGRDRQAANRAGRPDLYARDPARFERFTLARLEETRARCPAEEEWLELEMLREEIELNDTILKETHTDGEYGRVNGYLHILRRKFISERPHRWSSNARMATSFSGRGVSPG
jgi:hypothetical protein